MLYIYWQGTEERNTGENKEVMELLNYKMFFISFKMTTVFNQHWYVNI